MAYTLKANYARNIEILRENIKRGMTMTQCNNAIKAQEQQFQRVKLYGQEEQDYINAMRQEVINAFTHLQVEIIK